MSCLVSGREWIELRRLAEPVFRPH
uniref:Uncharacterized protein n=1 Tax=Anguilla anguilla TaxID=7936 RepID=A0A0E9WB21_ANGAN